MTKTQYALIATAMTSWPMIALAVPAAPVTLRVRQPDGRVVEVVSKGDERASWKETRDGFTVGQGAGRTWYYVQEYRNGQPTLTTTRADAPPPSGLRRRVRPPGQIRRADGGSFDVSKLAGGTHSGSMLMILVDYDDTPATYPDAADWAALLQSSDPAARSVANYYRAASYGRVDLLPAIESHGTGNDGVIGWLRINKPHPSPETLTDAVAKTAAYQQIYADAVTAADPYVDFSAYDVLIGATGQPGTDNLVQAQELAIVIVVAGGEAGYDGNRVAQTVWAHGDPSFSGPHDGMTVATAAVMGEVHAAVSSVPRHQATLGTVVHELGHVIFNLPDLYDNDSTWDGLDALSVMGRGNWGQATGDSYLGQTPVAFDAWSLYRLRWAYTRSGLISLFAAGRDGASTTPERVGIAHVAPTCSDDEYFLTQYRDLTGYDAGLAGLLSWVQGSFTPGVAVFHVDERHPDNNNGLLLDVEEFSASSPLWAVGASFDATSTPSSAANDGQASAISIGVRSVATTSTRSGAWVDIVSACDNLAGWQSYSPDLSSSASSLPQLPF
jgi:M6 family metalloprotease-like protein